MSFITRRTHSAQGGQGQLVARGALAGATLLAAGLGIAGAAQAADLPARAAPLPPILARPAFTWTGFYVGANTGWIGAAGQHNAFGLTPAQTFPLGKLSGNGGAFGGQIGYNQQFGSLVAGLEADLQGTTLHGRTTASFIAPEAYTLSARGRLPWYGTVRGRFGFAFNRTLIYATGGLAYGAPRYAVFGATPGGDTTTMSTSNMRTGYTLGAGVEYAFTDHWTTKLEYQYVNLGRERLSAPEIAAGGAPTGRIGSFAARPDFHTVRIGLNYKF